jgi:3-deoxy-D-manno-octulosonic acid kinase
LSGAEPGGFRAHRDGKRCLWVDPELAEAARAAGLDHEGGWRRRLEGERSAVARGAVARLDLGRGRRAVLKQLRRGGAVGRLWRDRFVGTRRLIDNLRVPMAAIERGVRTPRPLALLVVHGPPGLARGWLAQEEIAEAVDLATRFVSGVRPDAAELERAMGAVRRAHDAGLDHRDLNLGNLVLAPGEALLIDLDGARLENGPLPFPRRLHALQRLERSCWKTLGDRAGVGRDAHGWIYRGYAAGDAALARRLQGRGDPARLRRARRRSARFRER